MEDHNLRRTPLYDNHLKLGGRIVPFAGWELPVQYEGIIPEHRATRTRAGLFDVSHMGEIFVSGPQAEAALNYLTCNDVRSLSDGRAQYSAIINEKGGVVDDIIVYRFSHDKYLVCVNAANTEKDFAWFSSHNRHEAEFRNQSAEFAQIALQGPAASRIICSFSGDASLSEIAYFHFREASLGGTPAIIARTGYTGEDGFEFFIPWDSAPALWLGLLEAGKSAGLVPVGLGARDSLRLEACYPLHGHELGDDISAIESGIGWVVKADKGEFIGRDVLVAHKQGAAARALAGFFVEDAGIVRHGDRLFSEDGLEAGLVTSRTKTPTLDRALGLCLLKKEFAKVGTKLFAEVRGKRLRLSVVKRPFYSAPKAPSVCK